MGTMASFGNFVPGVESTGDLLPLDQRYILSKEQCTYLRNAPVGILNLRNFWERIVQRQGTPRGSKLSWLHGDYLLKNKIS
jgi:hypothetical protein